MLRFFRQIRQRLLADNKLSKYLLYAIGEIFLVVIGILIALQVNNWNEERKEFRQALSLLGNLKDELQQDSLHFRNVFTAEKTLFLPSAQRLFNAHRGFYNPSPGDSLLGQAFRFATFTPNIKYSDNAYRRLLTTDLLDALEDSDSLRLKLLEYYGQIDFLNLYAEQTLGIINDLSRELAPYHLVIPATNPDGRDISSFSGAGEEYFKAEYDLEAFRKNPALNPKLFDMIDIHKDRLGGLEIIRKLNADLLQILSSID
ncbi:DUF6090 family protein [Lentiprolixibacter aurantiacus]|uniref:DUF6090 family protein n=1 Tax=Lentiprolixibacter aurantiacus TaxID=2993939 RepID=A0AAE3MIS7_9FLAO|nr:DUF6090 family protein [Lentiprolixibacter aurantiacus]MCX2718460.1 DUF6090 family protein [Lentiprolixibacter aurantiacus]